MSSTRKPYSGGRYVRLERRSIVFKQVCGICGLEVRAGRSDEHRDCQREAERRADEALPNPRKGSQ